MKVNEYLVNAMSVLTDCRKIYRLVKRTKLVHDTESQMLEQNIGQAEFCYVIYEFLCSGNFVGSGKKFKFDFFLIDDWMVVAKVT